MVKQREQRRENGESRNALKWLEKKVCICIGNVICDFLSSKWKKKENRFTHIRRVRAIFGPFFRPSRSEPAAEYKVGYICWNAPNYLAIYTFKKIKGAINKFSLFISTKKSPPPAPLPLKNSYGRTYVPVREYIVVIIRTSTVQTVQVVPYSGCYYITRLFFIWLLNKPPSSSTYVIEDRILTDQYCF